MYKSNPSKNSWKYFFGFKIPQTGGADEADEANTDPPSIVDIVEEFKNGWYNNPQTPDANIDASVLEAEYGYFKHNNHTSWLFDIDTMHDTINPHKMPVDKINDFLVKGVKDIKKDEIPQIVLTLQNKIKTAKILNRNDIDTLDDKYTIVKDYGPGSHLLTLDCLIDSASTPSIKKFLKKKGDFFNIQERGSCIDKNTTNGPKPRTFDLTQSSPISCVDNNSSISGVDISLYKYLNNKYPEFFPDSDTDPISSELKNLILLNYIWQLNLYYCISKCVEPENPYKYSKALLTLNRLAFTGFEKTPGSFVPKFSYKNKPEAISKIQDTFLNKLKDLNYVEDGEESHIKTDIVQLNEKKEFVFNISQAEVAKHIINILQKRNLNDNSMAYNAANIISRNDGENVKDKDKTIKVLTNYYFKFFGDDKDDPTYVQYIFMLRLLKFMGDRSHIVMAKLVEKASGEDDDILSPILYTGERPLQVSSINEGLNTVMQHVSVHNNFSDAKHHDFLFCNSGLKPKEFSKLVCSKIISAFCWYYVQTNGNEPSDNYTIINTITSTSAGASHSISLRITFNKDNIVYIVFDNENSIKFFTRDDQKKALSSLEKNNFSKNVGGTVQGFVQNIEGLTSQISTEGNVPIILTNFFEQTSQSSDNNNIDDYKKLWQDYKVINNIEFGDMFTEFYGNTIKKLSGKKHLLELRRWIFQMLSINDKRPKGNILINEAVNNPKAAFFYFLCTSEEFGQGRSTLLILNTLEKALKQLETLYKYKETNPNPLLKQKAKNAYEDLCFKLSSIKPVVDLFHAVNLKVNLSTPEVKNKIKCDIDAERNVDYSNVTDLNSKLNDNVYLFNTEFKNNLNNIPINNPNMMTFRKSTGEWNKYCCNPILLSNNGIPEPEGNDNTNYMTRNPIYGSDSEQQKNNNNCVVNHDSRLNIYNKLLDIRELFYTSQLFKTDSAKEEIENIQKETIVEEVCFDAIGNNSEVIQAVLSDRATSESSDVSARSDFVLASDIKTKIDMNYKNLFDKISENYDYYKSDDITSDERKNHLIELGKRFFSVGYQIYTSVIRQPKVGGMNDGMNDESDDKSDDDTVVPASAESTAPAPAPPQSSPSNKRNIGERSPQRVKTPARLPGTEPSRPEKRQRQKFERNHDESLKISEWNEINNHFLFNCIVEYLMNIHFDLYLESGDGLINKDYFTKIPENYIVYNNLGVYDVDTNYDFIPIPIMSDLNTYIDPFNSHIYSIPITLDCDENTYTVVRELDMDNISRPASQEYPPMTK